MFRSLNSFIRWASLIVLFIMPCLPLMAQESPVTIHLYLFAMDEIEIKQVLQDGVTRAELDSLQGEFFAQNRLLETEKPLALAVGENNISIPAEKTASLAQGKSTIVFFYEIIPANDTEEISAGTLSRHSYVVTEKNGNVWVRDGVWNYPAKSNSYRYFDFRYANVLGHVEFVYELTAEFAGSPVVYKISVK